MAARPLRVFLGAFGHPGHAFPMLALGERLVERGHSVKLETWRRWEGHARQAGLEFLAAPEYPVFPSQDRPLLPYEAVARATLVTRQAVAQWRPDVVVADILTLAPALAGELEGVPVATLVPHIFPVSEPGFPPYAIGARLPRTRLGRALWRSLDPLVGAGLRRGRRELNETRQGLGLPPLEQLHGGLSRELCLVATFPQLEYPREWPAHVHVVGPIMWEPAAAEVAPPPGDGPLVLIAPSTAQDPDQRLLRVAIEGLERAPVRVLATTNRRPLPVPVKLGSNASLVNWLSYARTMPGASLVVCHAGHGTMVRALASGAPVLAVPHSGDMGENAARLDWAGAGVRLPWRLLSPATLRLAVARVLDEHAAFAARAAELAAWSAAQDGATRAAELIEQLASQ